MESEALLQSLPITYLSESSVKGPLSRFSNGSPLEGVAVSRAFFYRSQKTRSPDETKYHLFIKFLGTAATLH
jgi:hypothetical protein